MRIDLYLYSGEQAYVVAKRERQLIMASLKQIQDDMTKQTTLVDGLRTLITGLKQQLADALAGATLPAAVQAQVDAIFAAAETNNTALAAAQAAGTPAATGDPVPPVVVVNPV